MAPANETASEKAELRRRAKENRAALRPDHRRIQVGLARFLRSITEGWIVAFDAMPGEPDLAELRAGRIDPNVGPFALTRTPDEGSVLTIHPADSEMETHRYGFAQPVSNSNLVADDDIAAVLVPGLAFDRQGGRLGFGAGYYDRFLGRLDPGVIRVGVSDGFIVDEVPVDEHDISMTHLATEIGVVPLPL